jgi:hypothetical protein
MTLLFVYPGFSLCSNPGLQLANAFGVNFKLSHYPQIAQIDCVICGYYNDPHLLSGPQNFHTPRFTGNSIVHTSWCKES